MAASTLVLACAAQQQPVAGAAAGENAPRVSADAAPAGYTVAPGTKLPLSLINSISTKRSAVGDTVYLETAFPVLAGGRIVIPVGSYVTGTVTEIKRPRRMNGLGQLYIRFDSLTLPNGVTRDFHGRLNSLDGDSKGKLDPEGKVTAESNKAGDAVTVEETAGAGAGVGGIVGALGGHPGMGVGLGAAAGAAAGLIGVMSARPDAVLERGSTVEMVIDRPIVYNEKELDFGNYQAPHFNNPAPPAAAKKANPFGRQFIVN
jgi:type IV secretion system protein VirB10